MNYMFVFFNILIFFFQQDIPAFKGGQKALEAFFEQQMIYPTFSKNNCIESTVFVSFKLNEKGIVYDAKVERGLGIDLDEEALRLIKLTSGKWHVPQNNTDRLTIPVNFSLKNYNCENRSKVDIKNAIAYYTIREGLENTVFNYFKNKAVGKADEKDESKIIDLKNELGFDEDFENLKLDEAMQMLKQNDIEGACKTLQIVKNIGSNKADKLIAQYCN